MELELNGKAAVITGASKGIGRAVAETSPRAGYISGTVVDVDGGGSARP